MMLRQFFCLLACSLIAVMTVKACDACGCSVSSGGVGLLSDTRSNAIGFRGQMLRFQSVLATGEEHATLDRFRRIELWGRLFVHPRLQIGIGIPYRSNIRSGKETLPVNLSGLGDITLTARYLLWEKTATFSHRLELGGGVKLPTGTYNPIQDDRLPDNMNLGTASTDLSFSAIYVLSKNNWGWNTNVNYRWNTENKYNYRFGNQATIQSLWYLRAIFGRLQLVPYGGVYIEHIARDQLNGRTAHGTGGYGSYATLGFNVYLGAFNFTLTGQLPIDQHYSDGEVKSQRRLQANIAYLF